MLEELQKKVQEIKSVCRDRMRAQTDLGNELRDVFEDINDLIQDAMKLEPKKQPTTKK